MSLRTSLFFCFMLLNCSTETGVYRKSAAVVNSLPRHLPSQWSEIKNEGSDYALINSKSKSIFLFNSACRKFESSSLNSLTSSLLSGISGLNIIERKISSFHEREALEVLAHGKIDGVERFFKIVTVQKNSCIYDYVLIATSQSNIEQDSKALVEFVERIKLN